MIAFLSLALAIDQVVKYALSCLFRQLYKVFAFEVIRFDIETLRVEPLLSRSFVLANELDSVTSVCHLHTHELITNGLIIRKLWYKNPENYTF